MLPRHGDESKLRRSKTNGRRIVVVVVVCLVVVVVVALFVNGSRGPSEPPALIVQLQDLTQQLSGKVAESEAQFARLDELERDLSGLTSKVSQLENMAERAQHDPGMVGQDGSQTGRARGTRPRGVLPQGGDGGGGDVSRDEFTRLMRDVKELRDSVRAVAQDVKDIKSHGGGTDGGGGRNGLDAARHKRDRGLDRFMDGDGSERGGEAIDLTEARQKMLDEIAAVRQREVDEGRDLPPNWDDMMERRVARNIDYLERQNKALGEGGSGGDIADGGGKPDPLDGRGFGFGRDRDRDMERDLGRDRDGDRDKDRARDFVGRGDSGNAEDLQRKMREAAGQDLRTALEADRGRPRVGLSGPGSPGAVSNGNSGGSSGSDGGRNGGNGAASPSGGSRSSSGASVSGGSPALNLVDQALEAVDRDAVAAAAAGAAAATQGSAVLSDVVDSPATRIERRAAVVDAFRHAWKGYKSYAWGKDALQPVSKTAYDRVFGLGLTIVDSLDTMLLMGLDEEFAEAEDWIANELFFGRNQNINLFETTIRVLGGLLSGHYLSDSEVLLRRAVELADKLIVAFDTSSGIPFSDVNLGSGKASGQESSTSEVATLQLEWRYLSAATGDSRYGDAVTRVDDILAAMGGKVDGLVPIYLQPRTGKFSGQTITLGARGDSYYEYLLKQYVQTNGTEAVFLARFEEAMAGVEKHLVSQSEPSKLTFVGELISNRFDPKMDHLVCFLPGTLALASQMPDAGTDYMDLAEALMETCVEMYDTPLGLAPEIVRFNQDKGGSEDIIIKRQDSHCLLRPETVESLFILHRITGDAKYSEWAWQIFTALEKHAKIETGGYSSISSVLDSTPAYRDKMESFFLGETLKYLYLTFSPPDLLPFDEVVFNTEAHPFPVYTPGHEVPPGPHLFSRPS